MTDAQLFMQAVLDWPYFLPTYLAIGFLMGVAIIKWPGERCESPGGTLMSATFAGPLILSVMGPIVLVCGFFSLIAFLLGAEPYQGDSHGV